MKYFDYAMGFLIVCVGLMILATTYSRILHGCP